MRLEEVPSPSPFFVCEFGLLLCVGESGACVQHDVCQPALGARTRRTEPAGYPSANYSFFLVLLLNSYRNYKEKRIIRATAGGEERLITPPSACVYMSVSKN